MADLSPIAQAAYEAARDAYWIKDVEHPADAEVIAAAALRAAGTYSSEYPLSRADLLYIATEFENQ